MMINNYTPKLIISDVDGTLVEYASDLLSTATVTAVTKVKKLGLAFTLATGRSWLKTRKIARELEVSLPVVLQTGAIIMDPLTEKVIRVQPLRAEIEEELRRIVLLPHVDRLCLDESGIYYTTELKTGSGQLLLTSGEKCFSGQTELPEVGRVIKHLFIGAENEIKDLLKQIRTVIEPTPNCVLWPPDPQYEDWFLEVFDPSATKGQALEWIARNLGIRSEEVIALGDSYNDIDMLNRAGLGVAVETAPPEILRVAKQLMPGPDQDGVACFLKKHFAIG